MISLVKVYWRREHYGMYGLRGDRWSVRDKMGHDQWKGWHTEETVNHIKSVVHQPGFSSTSPLKEMFEICELLACKAAWLLALKTVCSNMLDSSNPLRISQSQLESNYMLCSLHSSPCDIWLCHPVQSSIPLSGRSKGLTCKFMHAKTLWLN